MSWRVLTLSLAPGVVAPGRPDDLAEVLTLARRLDEAGELVRQALELYEQKGNVVLVDRARSTLVSLSPWRTIGRRY